MFSKILISNRAEIACRVIRAAGAQAIFHRHIDIADAAHELPSLIGENRSSLGEATE